MNKKAEGWVGTSVMLLILEEMLAVFSPLLILAMVNTSFIMPRSFHPLVYPVFLMRECGVLS